MFELWMGDDQMPSCNPCLDGQHDKCLDLIFNDKYGTFACGCGNAVHE